MTTKQNQNQSLNTKSNIMEKKNLNKTGFRTFAITTYELAEKMLSAKKIELAGLMTHDEFLRKLESYGMVFDNEFLKEAWDLYYKKLPELSK